MIRPLLALTPFWLALPAAPASAHPLDEVIQQVYLTPAATTLDVQIDIVAGALVAPGFARSLDTDGDRRLSAAETAAHDVRVKSALALATDGAAAGFTVTGSAYPPYDLLAAGGGVITVRATAPLPASAGAFALTDGYRTDQKTRIQISVLVARGAGRAAGSIRRGHEGRAIAVGLTRDASPPAAAPVAGNEGTGGALLDALRTPVESPWALAVLIAVCALLGAFHALTPGHGKAMLAAYLVGSRGTVRQAVALGGVVTVTHTGSVLLLGAVVLAAGHYVVPGLLVPGLKVAAGAVVLVLGLRILRQRSRIGRHGHGLGHADAHGHGHGHGHAHAHGHGHANTHGYEHGHARGQGYGLGQGHGHGNAKLHGHRHVHPAWDESARRSQHSTSTQVNTTHVNVNQLDTSPVDTNGVDAGRVDAGRVDAGWVDAGRVDAGRRVEASRVKAGRVDAGHGNVGGVDAGSVDTSQPREREHADRPSPAFAGRRELAAMGAAGGLIPCPEALGVLILATGLHRTALGLTMIVAFSMGLGTVLVGLGLILVTVRDRFTDVRPGPLLRRLPVVSAAVVVVLGVAMTMSGLADAAGA